MLYEKTIAKMQTDSLNVFDWFILIERAVVTDIVKNVSYFLKLDFLYTF